MPHFCVPASTTNLGSGFDCLGMALGAANLITVEAGAPPMVDEGLRHMSAAVRSACMQRWGVSLPVFGVSVTGTVPIARGMGSSSTILLGVAAGCQRLAGRPFARAELMEIAAGLEGHPDNVAAACLGGFTVVAQLPTGLRCARFDIPTELKAVVAIPDFEVKTSEARRILPAQLTRADAVCAWQKTALITAALASGRLEDLSGLFDDAWHERFRASLNPGLEQARGAAQTAGAIGTILSGSGSTVLSFVRAGVAEAVAKALSASYRQRGAIADVKILDFDNQGVREVADTRH